jgi:threonine/homoserine/homoserine lactone efflux protein
LLNPKTTLFFLAFLPQFVDPARGAVPLQIAFLGLLFTLMGLTSDGLYALIAGTAGVWVKRQSRYLDWERYVTGCVFIGLGVTACAPQLFEAGVFQSIARPVSAQCDMIRRC